MVTRFGDRITALASAGTLYLSSYQNEILTRSGCGSILSILPTFTPRITTLSPAKMLLALSKYPTTWVRPPDGISSATTPPISATTTATARAILVLRDFTVDPPARVADPAADRRTGWVPARV